MFSAKFLLTFAIVSAGAWGASTGPERWQLLLQVVCAIVMSLTIFLAVLRATERDRDNATDTRIPTTRSDATSLGLPHPSPH
jgi:hypothetical protein